MLVGGSDICLTFLGPLPVGSLKVAHLRGVKREVGSDVKILDLLKSLIRICLLIELLKGSLFSDN